MSNLKQIEHRHGRDRWKDAVFIAAAVLLTALSIGATTSQGVGKPVEHQWSVQVVDPDTNVEIAR
ncbi:MAG: hypothetical protein H0V17_11795 [Deltaproteobacteria bacterium]|jgi:hypothetical protein|nr:hypothetical protein [Deltaproteobacteria bacterium]